MRAPLRRWRGLVWREPAFFAALLDRLVEATSAYLISQVEAGAEALQLFDSWAGAVPASLFETLVIAPTAQIVRAVRARHSDIPIIGFPRGAGSHLAAYIEQTGVDAVGVDYMTGLGHVLEASPRRLALQGNLDPVLLRDGGEAMAVEIRNILAAMQGHPFIFNLGHGVLPSTPPEHVAELVGFVRGAPQ
jgi:uroporphyrinogen decarboxylase